MVKRNKVNVTVEQGKEERRRENKSKEKEGNYQNKITTAKKKKTVKACSRSPQSIEFNVVLPQCFSMNS